MRLQVHTVRGSPRHTALLSHRPKTSSLTQQPGTVLWLWGWPHSVHASLQNDRGPGSETRGGRMTPCEHGAGGGPDHRDVLKWPGAHSGGLGPALCVTSAESVALDGADVCPQPPQVTAWSRTSASAFPRSHTPRLKSHGEASVAKPEGFPNRPGPLEAPERGYTEPSTPVSQTRGGSGGVWENGRASVGETGLTPDLRRLPPHRVPAPCPRRCWLPLRLLCYPAKISGPSMPETKPVKDGSKLPDCPGRRDRSAWRGRGRKRPEETRLGGGRP